MDIWTQIWGYTDVDGKVHKSVVKAVLDKLDLSTNFGSIYVMVELHGITDDSDKLATARAIRRMRDIRRASGEWNRKAICA